MKNWTINETAFKKQDPKQFKLWQTEQLINFGVGRHKIDKNYLKSVFPKLTIDPKKKAYLSYLLWGKKSSPKLKKNS